jgi:hypothetical protein
VDVLPENPAEPSDGDSDPGNDDDNFNEGLCSDPLTQLPSGLVSEVGLEAGLSQFATSQGTIVIGDPDGIGDIVGTVGECDAAGSEDLQKSSVSEISR